MGISCCSSTDPGFKDFDVLPTAAKISRTTGEIKKPKQKIKPMSSFKR
jgi:hypothetical protein